MSDYRQETANARSGVHTPRSTLASRAGQAGAALAPLWGVQKRFVLGCRVLHADDTPVALLDPGAGKTKRAYVWAYARSHDDPTPGVVYDFCLARRAKYPIAFLAGDAARGQPHWAGTLLTTATAPMTPCSIRAPTRAARARPAWRMRARKFDEFAKAGTSAVAAKTIKRFARIYEVERGLGEPQGDERQVLYWELARRLREKLKTWLQLERRLVVNHGTTAKAIDYMLGHWSALTHHMDDGAVAIDNNHIERWIKPWAMGRKAWMFVGGEVAGQQATMVMSLVQIGQTQWPRPVGLPARRAAAAADATQ